ncbi:MAG TPA: alpha/beta fold hydrolase, partial [Gemmatimonadaceae bacterium]|nr:alpha/beta fold hydrolase [Gemmatimonadaceae bacterium]
MDVFRPHLPAPAHAFDFAGHGTRSSEPGAFSIERFAGDVIAYLDAHDISRAAFVGYSMGGYVALYLAVHHPERVARVVTLGTKLAWSPEAAARETRLLDPDVIAVKVPGFAAVLAERHGVEYWAEVCRRTAGMLRELGERPVLGYGAFAGIGCPVRLAVGNRDGTVSVEEKLAVSRVIGGAELAVLP